MIPDRHQWTSTVVSCGNSHHYTHSTTQYGTVQHSTVLHSTVTVLHSTVLHSTVLHSTVLHSTVLHSTHYSTTQYCTTQYTLQYNTVLYYTVLYYTVLYYTVQYYTVLYYTVLHNTRLCYTTPHYCLSAAEKCHQLVSHRDSHRCQLAENIQGGSSTLSAEGTMIEAPWDRGGWSEETACPFPAYYSSWRAS